MNSSPVDLSPSSGTVQEEQTKAVLKDLIVSENDPVEHVADRISFHLDEPNDELIYNIVSTLGTLKSAALYKRTQEVEENGGLYVQDGTRRKTPGGVFFHLVNSDETIPKNVVKNIFLNASLEKKKLRNEEAKRRRKQHNEELRKMLVNEGLLSTSPS